MTRSPPSADPGLAVYRPAVYRHFHRIAWLAVALTLCVAVFGAYVRLSDAGLGCPDWPTCYGRAAWPTAVEGVRDTGALDMRPLEVPKAWREQVHRHLAATLGVLVLVLALLAARRWRLGITQILVAAGLVALAIPLYMRGEHVAASALAISGEAILLSAALRWSNLDPGAEPAPYSIRGPGQSLARVSTLALAVIVFQALLGMWTVTWLLKPVVVMGHLLGGLLTFSLLTWIAWRATDRPIRLIDADALRRAVWVALAVLALQIALGGWVSANYAALSCGAGSWSADNFPKCVGLWTPPADFREGFVLWRGAFAGHAGVDYEGGVLDGASRIAIQLAHRMMAVVASAALLWAALKFLRTPGVRSWGVALAALTVAQVALGILNVKLALPLSIAVLHNAGAVLLLFVLVTLLARLRPPG